MSSGDWWDDISVYESDYVPGTFTPGSSVETNHKLLAGMRENDFDTSDSAYSESLMPSKRTARLARCFVLRRLCTHTYVQGRLPFYLSGLFYTW